MLQAGRSRVRDPMRGTFFNFSAALVPGVYSASSRNEYQKQRSDVSGK
jgi:hypothetical protein